MFDAVWSRVAGQSYRHGPAELPGFSRHAVRDELYPALVRSNLTANIVTGVLYYDVSPDDLQRLDTFEGRQYQRIDCQVRRLENRSIVDAQVYLFLQPELLLPQDWDAAQFAASGIEPFLASYAPKP